MKKVLYFIAADTETADEMAMIASFPVGVQVLVRNAVHVPALGTAILEPADGLAGTIPAAYKTASGNTIVDTALYPMGDVTPNNVNGIDGVFIYPAAPGVTGTASLQLRAVKVEVAPDTGIVTTTEVTSACVWTSATTAKATIVSGTGIATGVAAGTSVISASYDYDGAGSHAPIVAHATFTVS